MPGAGQDDFGKPGYGLAGNAAFEHEGLCYALLKHRFVGPACIGMWLQALA